MNNPQHLFLRHQTWFVKKRVPSDLRTMLNKSVIVKSTGKRDVREAISERNKLLGEIEHMFEYARNPKDTRKESFKGTVNWLREEQRQGEWTQEVSPVELADIAFDTHYFNMKTNTYSIPSEDVSEIHTLRRLVEQPEADTLKDTIAQYIEQKTGTIRESTLREKQSHLEDFSKWIGPSTFLTDISAKDAGNFLSHVLLKKKTKTGEALSSETLKKHLNIFKAFFNWTESMGMTEKNPFSKTADRIPKATTGGASTKVKAWNEDEIVQLLEAIKTKGNHKLAAITLLAMYTGARGNELAELKTVDVTSWSLKIQSDTKNMNSQRSIPIHPMIQPLVERLMETSTDGYLISGLRRGGEDNKRFHYMSKSFSEMKDKLGFPKRIKVFHSFRHSVVTLLHNAGESVDRIAAVVGHIEDMNFTLDTYSDGLKRAEAIKILEKLDYREKVNLLVDELTSVTTNH